MYALIFVIILTAFGVCDSRGEKIICNLSRTNSTSLELSYNSADYHRQDRRSFAVFLGSPQFAIFFSTASS